MDGSCKYEYGISSREQLTRGGSRAWVLGEVLTIPRRQNPRNVSQDLGHGTTKVAAKAHVVWLRTGTGGRRL
jgi:hypothetical protein